MDSRDVLTFLRGLKLSSTLLRNMAIKLLAVQTVLDDAEAKQFTVSAVRVWLDELRDAVYDAEDLMDDINTEALSCKMECSDSQSQQVRNIISGEEIKSRVEEITDTLEYLAQNKDVFGLKEGVVGNLSNRWPTTSLVDESRVYGRDDNRETMVEFLLSHNASDENKIGVIALVGMGGIGKTTLAQLVYKDRRVVNCFDLKGWVCVSEEFDLVKITKTILKAITSGTPENPSDDNDLNLLQCKLEERLSRKKFLLVLDDVWNENYNDLEKLQLPLSAGLRGSKIIVTTRSGVVARVMRSVRIDLGLLSRTDCWLLFAKHAFENGDSSPHPRLEEIGKEIVKKCKGLPLVAKTLGAALYSELRVKAWENVLNSKTWDFPNDEILPALRLSYSFLPSQLKRCFAYCSIFPKDYEFEKENLIMLWMAEGFLQQTEGIKTMEEVGDGYFHDLVSRSFFHKSSIHKSYFVMHDLINDLAQLVFGKFCAQLKDGKMNGIPEKLRHLSYFRSRYDHFDIFETLNEVNRLRTFLPLHLRTLPRLDKVSKERCPDIGRYVVEFRISNRVWNDLLPKVQYLRVLSLCYYKTPDLPDSIGNLKNLRYLDLTYARIRRLPDSICSLYNLQTLILYHCIRLLELPKMMWKMISLRHLDIKGSKVKEMPSHMGQLKGLQKLSNYAVGKKSGTRIAELRELSHIGGSLVLQVLQNVVDAKDALETNLVGKQYLNELQLEWDRHRGDDKNGADTVLKNLQPHSNLKRLTIYRYGGSRFPDWFGGSSIQNMVSIRLWDCNNVSAFPPLGQLPSLKHLYIYGLNRIERVGAEFYGTDPSFVSLRALSFQRMSKWKEWLCLEGQGGELFPRLKELHIENCPMLTGDFPTHLPFLKRLVLFKSCELVASLPRVPALRELKTSGRDISQWKELPSLLQELYIADSDYLASLLEEGMLQHNTNLENLTIRNCSFSRPLNRVCLPLTLKSLRVEGCKKLEFLLPEFLKCHHPSLQSFEILGGTCNYSLLDLALGNIPRGHSLTIHHLKELEFLSISVSEGDLPSFDRLSISSCLNLVSICCKNMKTARSLRISSCPKLIFPIQDLPSSLTSLSITNCDKFTSQVEFGLQGLPSLTFLSISYLQNLNSLDSWKLQLFTSLQVLRIGNCPKLQSLTKERLPTSLSFLEIQNCPLLEDQCKSCTREDWPRIAHIPHIVINDHVL